MAAQKRPVNFDEPRRCALCFARHVAKPEHLSAQDPNAVKAVRGAALALGVGAGCGRIQYVTVSTLLRLGLTDVRALARADRQRHDHQPHHQGARRQAVPRLVGSHCRQSDLRRTVGVALLVSRYPSRISPQSTGARSLALSLGHISRRWNFIFGGSTY